jgi:hypothetical protein
VCRTSSSLRATSINEDSDEAANEDAGNDYVVPDFAKESVIVRMKKLSLRTTTEEVKRCREVVERQVARVGAPFELRETRVEPGGQAPTLFRGLRHRVKLSVAARP